GDRAAADGQKMVRLIRNWDRVEASWGRDEDATLAALEENYQLDPTFRDTSGKLYSALYSRAIRLRDSGDRQGAIDTLRHALDVNPKGEEARAALTALTSPPTPSGPSPTGQPRSALPANGGALPAGLPSNAPARETLL